MYTVVQCNISSYLVQLGVRDYVRCLENSVIRGLAEFGVNGFTTENVGVWVKGGEKEEKKICAIGMCCTTFRPWLVFSF